MIGGLILIWKFYSRAKWVFYFNLNIYLRSIFDFIGHYTSYLISVAPQWFGCTHRMIFLNVRRAKFWKKNAEGKSSGVQHSEFSSICTEDMSER
jgi:hypothetical protein